MSKTQVSFKVREVEVNGFAYNGPAYEVVRNDGFVWRIMRFYEDAVKVVSELNAMCKK